MSASLLTLTTVPLISSNIKLSDDQLYTIVLQKRTIAKKLFFNINRTVPNSIDHYEWERCVSVYYSDLINFPEQEKDIFASFIRHIAVKTRSDTEVIRRLAIETNNRVTDSSSTCTSNTRVGPIIARLNEHKRITLTVGEINMDIPEACYSKINGDLNQLRGAVLRYSILNPTSGMFWSLHSGLYEEMIKSSTLPFVEGFASPFNFNTKNFCSLFNKDKDLSYPDGVKCNGDFFQFIDELNIPMNMILNPPYSDRIIDKTVDSVIPYLMRCTSAHMILALPDWDSKRYL